MHSLISVSRLEKRKYKTLCNCDSFTTISGKAPAFRPRIRAFYYFLHKKTFTAGLVGLACGEAEDLASIIRCPAAISELGPPWR